MRRNGVDGGLGKRLRRKQRLLGLPEFGDVQHQAYRAGKRAVFAPYRMRVDQHLATRQIGAFQHVLGTQYAAVFPKYARRRPFSNGYLIAFKIEQPHAVAVDIWRIGKRPHNARAASLNSVTRPLVSVV